MRLHRFYLETKIDAGLGELLIGAEVSRQIRKVFRLTKGDRVILFDGAKVDYISEIVDITADDLKLKILSQSPSAFIPAKNITLYASIIKKDHFELVVEKATELGVTKINPILSARSEKKGLNMTRLKKIAVEAAEQSGRGDIPHISDIVSLEEALHTKSLDANTNKIMFHTNVPKFDFSKYAELQNIDIFIGPEGGWTEEEVSLARECGVEVAGLGEGILRAETATIAALSALALL